MQLFGRCCGGSSAARAPALAHTVLQPEAQKPSLDTRSFIKGKLRTLESVLKQFYVVCAFRWAWLVLQDFRRTFRSCMVRTSTIPSGCPSTCLPGLSALTGPIAEAVGQPYDENYHVVDHGGNLVSFVYRKKSTKARASFFSRLLTSCSILPSEL